MSAGGDRIRARWRRLTADSERGSGGGMSLVMLISAVALLVVIGLVVDGGGKAQAMDRASRIASEAARAGLQAAVPGNAVSTAGVLRAVDQYLGAEGVTGRGSVTGNLVRVTVTITEPTIFLSLIGVDEFTVSADGSAEILFN